jgi:hypothetical protein
MLMVSNNYGLSLEDIIREFHKESKEYLKRAGIEIKGIRLRILESSDLLQELYEKINYMINTYDINKLRQELNTIDKSLLEQVSNYDDIYIIKKENLREFYIGEIYLLKQKYNTDDINELNNKILKYIVLPIKKNERADGLSVSQTEEIFLVEDRLKNHIDETLKLNRFGSININGPSIIRVKSPLSEVIYTPLYTEGKNIEKDLTEFYVGNVILHEKGHRIVNRGKWDDDEFLASALQYIIYIDMHDLLRYPETHEIIKENIQECKKYVGTLAKFGYHIAIEDLPESTIKYVTNVLKRAPYELGLCYANIIIDRNKNLNIKDVVEEVKKLSPLNVIDKIILY